MFLHSSLDTKFNITCSRSDFFSTWYELRPTDNNLVILTKSQYIKPPTEERKAIIYLAATENCGNPHTGYAFTASICDSDARRATSMICWYNSTLVTAGIVAHEIGHTVGFFHDFAPVTTAKYSNARTRTYGPGKNVGGPDNMIMNYNWDKV